MTKRPAGTGTARQRGRGTWEYRITIGTDQAGKQIRRSCTVKANNKTEAERLGREKLAHLVEEHSPTAGGRTLTAAFEIWMADTEYKKAPNTTIAHRRQFARYVEPVLGRIPIGDIQPMMLDDFYRDLRRPQDGQNPLSSSSIRRIHSIMSGTLRHAWRRGWIEQNPAGAAEPPRIPHRSAVLDADNTLIWNAIYALSAKNRAQGIAAAIGFYTGMRRGEVAALTWGDISADRIITVSRSIWKAGGQGGIKSTKTERVRTLPCSQGLFETLYNWADVVSQSTGATDISVMSDWYITSDEDDKTIPMDIDHLTYGWTKAAASVGLQGFPFKAFRSLAATRLLAGGISPVDAAELLGHAKPSMTMDVYGKNTTPGKIQSMMLLDEASRTPKVFISADTSPNEVNPERLSRRRTNSVLDLFPGGVDDGRAGRPEGLDGTRAIGEEPKLVDPFANLPEDSIMRQYFDPDREPVLRLFEDD